MEERTEGARPDRAVFVISVAAELAGMHPQTLRMYERKGLLGNLLNFGTVYITVGGNKMAFEDVMDPATVQSDIDRRRMARQQKKNEAAVAAERERMAEWLVTYHNNAEEFRKAEEEKRKQQNDSA